MNSKLDNDDEAYLHPDGTVGTPAPAEKPLWLRMGEARDALHNKDREAELVWEALKANPSMSLKDAHGLVAGFLTWRAERAVELQRAFDVADAEHSENLRRRAHGK